MVRSSRISAALIAVVGVFAVAAPSVSGVQASAACSGRSLFSCPEKQAIFGDDVISNRSFVLDSELFELRLPLGLSDPSLRHFWRFEMAAAGARSLWDLYLINQLPDPYFEQQTTPITITPVVVTPTKVVDRRTARAMNSLIAAETAEIINYQGLLVAMDRATGASLVAGRGDWVTYQESLAGGFARRTAGALHRMLSAQRAVAASFTRLKLRFGVGAVDLARMKSEVRRNGLAGTIASALRAVSLNQTGIAFCAKELRTAPANPITYSLTELLRDGSTTTVERNLASALSTFAAQAPHGVPEPA
ncbi:MAG: hypothetical protein ACYDHH_20730 [Solirubrobacteraceae bacterium]